MQHPPVKGAAPPRTPLVEGAAPPGIYFGTLRRVGLRKTTDVLEVLEYTLWSSVLWMLEEYYPGNQIDRY